VVALIEAAHGPAEVQLALPLRRIAEECLRDRRDPEVAHVSIDRAMALTFGTIPRRCPRAGRGLRHAW
jgi:hypothetical protein